MPHRARWFLSLVAIATATGALAAPDDGPKLDLPIAKRPALSPQEQLAQAKVSIAKLQEILKKALTLHEKAKKDKDVIRLNCLNDKIVQIRGHIAVGDRTLNGLTEAVGKLDAEASQHEYGRVKIVLQKVQVLGTEAENCVGEISLFPEGGGEVLLDIDPSIPTTDPTTVYIPDLAPIARPTEASPTL